MKHCGIYMQIVSISLDEALDAAQIDRSDAYITNVVKHFKWEPRGKRRLHKRPNAGEVSACRPWFDAELALIQPEVLVCLGATAARALGFPARKSASPKLRTQFEANPAAVRRFECQRAIENRDREDHYATL